MKPEIENALERCEELIKDSVVSDVIHVDVEELKKIGAYGMNMNAELLIADMVPITDMELKMLYPGTGTSVARFVVDPAFANTFSNINDYRNNEGKLPTGVLAMAVAMRVKDEFKQVVIPITVSTETGKFEIVAGASLVSGEIKPDRIGLDSEVGEMLAAIAIEALQTWHFIQVCLTNPPIRERFAALSGTKAIPKGDSKKKRGSVRYVKTHYLDPEEWGIIKRSESGRTYTCLAWYVMGHWREYKNGHRVFIKPYWKGTMRNRIEEAGDVSRNRIVAQMETVIA